MYVAQFYWERNKPMGTVLRLRKLLDNHRGTHYDPTALLLLGKAYIRVKMPESCWACLAVSATVPAPSISAPKRR